jgi:hypothetical protein
LQGLYQLPIRFLGDGVLVAIADPELKDLISTLSTHIGRKVYPALADGEAIKKAIDIHYPNGREVGALQEKGMIRASRTISIISNKAGLGRPMSP